MIEIEKGSGNVYEDLGFPDSEEMLLKAQLVSSIHDLITSKSITRMQASEIIDMPQPALSRMLKGQFRDVSVSKMLEAISRLGRDIQIVIGPEIMMNGQIASGHIEVVQH